MAAIDATPEQAYVIGAFRTPICSMDGDFRLLTAEHLGQNLLRDSLSNLEIPPTLIDKVYIGQSFVTNELTQEKEMQFKGTLGLLNISSLSVIQEDCLSSLRAIYNGYRSIKFGLSNINICGGQEICSNVSEFNLYEKWDTSPKRQLSIWDHPVNQGLVVGGISGRPDDVDTLISGERLARDYNIGRAAQDRWTMESIEKAHASFREHGFSSEIIPIQALGKVSKDEMVVSRLNENLRSLYCCSALMPASREYYYPTITSSNSAMYADGAALLVLSSRQGLEDTKKSPLAKITSIVEFKVTSKMDSETAQIFAIRKVFHEARWNAENVDLFEIYEPYAAQPIRITQALKISPLKVNVSGGTVVFGNPIGATAARMAVTLIHDLRRTGLLKGIVSLYTAYGHAMAMGIERC